MIKIYNLTGHPLDVSGTTIPSHGSVRLGQIVEEVETLDTNYGKILVGTNEYLGAILPKEKKDTIIVVGHIVAQAFPDRGDLYIPWAKQENGKRRGIARNPYFNPLPIQECD